MNKQQNKKYVDYILITIKVYDVTDEAEKAIRAEYEALGFSFNGRDYQTKELTFIKFN